VRDLRLRTLQSLLFSRPKHESVKRSVAESAGVRENARKVVKDRPFRGVVPSMPIRFRCRYCDQLLGIARRKAGLTVKCPTCQRELTVPSEDQSNGPAHEPSGTVRATAESSPASGGGPLLFDRDDFDEILNPSARATAPSAPPQPPPVRVPPPPPPEAAPEGFALPQGGIVLSPARATALTVLFVVGLAVAFGAGLLVGRFCF
jgi:phage FluMu protein Com